ncbi:hypothetical protein ACWOA4_05840 [Pediococcus pentosaceus]|uniref:hypothetical protein n=1 Tax=Pediococcus pentosaceus TaxID=1255 RepID=UPI0013301814|nr:hypothetical protein [Pediococcus pentosaceus]MBF7105536.1 hypothetical protein [Pediococcus pentosaceus]
MENSWKEYSDDKPIEATPEQQLIMQQSMKIAQIQQILMQQNNDIAKLKGANA